ncbi:MAG: hypothetical protein AMXMBFR84_05810 [Candidatus Hydrogenedentota bacterium]
MQESMSAIDTESQPVTQAKPWGPWATIGFGIVIAGAFLLTQMVVVVAGAVVEILQGNALNPYEFGERLETSGDFLAIATFATVPVVVGLCVAAAALKKGITVREYLGLHWVPGKVAIKWILAVFAFAICSDLLSFLLGRPMIPDFMRTVIQSTTFLPLLAAALVVAAPLTEEFFFRGFLFKGMENTRLRGAGTVILTSVLWAVIHIQYDWYGVVTIIVIGLVIGSARHKTKSVPLCIALHSLVNLISTVESYVLMQMLPPPA